MLMKVIYIAGPFSDGDPIHGIGRCILNASEIALEAWRAGFAAICPHKNTAGFQHARDIDPETWYAGDLAMMIRCDAVVMMPGWEKSRGATYEEKIAREVGMPVFYYEVTGMPTPAEVVV